MVIQKSSMVLNCTLLSFSNNFFVLFNPLLFDFFCLIFSDNWSYSWAAKTYVHQITDYA